MLNSYLPVFITLAFAIALSCILLAISRYVGWRKPGEAKQEPFECGNLPSSDARTVQFSVKFYMTALLFLIFDMETIFVLVWAAAFGHFRALEGGREIAMFLFISMNIFIAVLIVGYIYVWRRGGFTWR